MSIPRSPDVIVTLPVRDTINGALRSALEECGLPWLAIYGMSDLARARSVLLSRAVESGASRVVCIDADIIATAEQIQRLARHPRVCSDGAATGLYALRSGKAWACHAPDAEDEPDGCRRAVFAGLGFACIARESLLLARQRLVALTDADAGEWHPYCVPFVGEEIGGFPAYCADDVALWRRLAWAGVTLWADTRLVVGHQALTTLMSPVLAQEEA